jgi:hypothetical protein
MITARRRVPVKTTALAAMTAKKDLAQGQALLLSTWDAARRALEVGAIPTGNDLKAIGENGGAYTLRRKRITLPDNPKNRIQASAENTCAADIAESRDNDPYRVAQPPILAWALGLKLKLESFADSDHLIASFSDATTREILGVRASVPALGG